MSIGVSDSEERMVSTTSNLYVVSIAQPKFSADTLVSFEERCLTGGFDARIRGGTAGWHLQGLLKTSLLENAHLDANPDTGTGM